MWDRELLKSVIKTGIKEPVLIIAQGYQVNSVVLGKLKPIKLM
jgi:hypothetical protein